MTKSSNYSNNQNYSQSYKNSQNDSFNDRFSRMSKKRRFFENFKNAMYFIGIILVMFSPIYNKLTDSSISILIMLLSQMFLKSILSFLSILRYGLVPFRNYIQTYFQNSELPKNKDALDYDKGTSNVTSDILDQDAKNIEQNNNLETQNTLNTDFIEKTHQQNKNFGFTEYKNFQFGEKPNPFIQNNIEKSQFSDATFIKNRNNPSVIFQSYINPDKKHLSNLKNISGESVNINLSKKDFLTEILDQEYFGFALRSILFMTIIAIISIYILFKMISILKSTTFKFSIRNGYYGFLNQIMSIIEKIPFLNYKFAGRYLIKYQNLEIY